MNKEKYLKNPNECPFCGSNKINGTGSIEGDNFSEYDCECQDCKKKWTEFYSLVDIKEIFYK